jgi:hypothetical protein
VLARLDPVTDAVSRGKNVVRSLGLASAVNGYGGWRYMEDKISSCLTTTGAAISMNVDLDYKGQGVRKYVPTRITVVLTVNGSKKAPIVFNDTRVRDPRKFDTSSCTQDWL